jgi:GNAT superfamily N-acetyltransferase
MGQQRLRLARPEDASAIAVLARRVVRRWIIPNQPRQGAVALEAALTTPVIRDKILAGQRFYLAFVDDTLAGIAAVRNDTHVFQLFVGTRHQGQGIARKLWNRLRRDCMRRAGTRVFTLNAAHGAIPAYLHLGFIWDSDPRRVPGVVESMPMIYRVDEQS